jgi:hypothetical protein
MWRREETPLRVSRQWPYVTYSANGNLVNMKDLRFRVKMMCLLRTIRLFKKSIICIYHIIKYSWHRFTLNWTVMWFLYISHATVKGSKWEICFNQIGRKVPLKYILQHHLFRWQKLQWTKEKGDKMTNTPQSTIQIDRQTDRQTDNRQTDRQTDSWTVSNIIPLKPDLNSVATGG